LSATAARLTTVVATRAETENIERFTDRYGFCCSPVRLAIERDTLDADYGSTGYTTRAQADELARHLRLQPGHRLADIGSGSGWPGLYLAQQTGCHVIGTDLSLDGLQRARARSITDGLAGRVSYAVATGRDQPFRHGSFDAVVHTDVLCCLGPKLAVLRACHRLLRPGGRLAFTTIHVAPHLDARGHRRAVRAGPSQVATRRPYPELVAQADFHHVAVIDVTPDYARTQRAWLAATESRAAEVRRITSDREFATAQADRRYAQAAIEEGLLRRSLITAVRH
jgi:cyclopropane fatty-acyl-phospholipid synthase-like methyltransferase